MTGKLLLTLKWLINILTYTMIGLWSLLTAIVVVFLIDRWTNPGWKSISNHDLKDYGLITIVVLLIVGFMFFMKFLINKQLVSK
jgi:hypothetical protein